MRCIECACAGAGTKAPPEMAEKGFAICAHERKPGVYVALLFNRDCSLDFVTVPAETAAQREEWVRSNL